jgi:ribosomal-protein-alanine N-acetyltransferase
MQYRPYKPEDFAQLYALEEVCFEPEFRFSRALMRDLVGSRDAAAWIAEDGAQIAGFAIVEWALRAGSVTAYIATVEVLPQKRTLGIGNELLRLAEQSAQAAGADEIWLHVDAENAGAISLYEAHGYQRKGAKANFYPGGRTALVYARRLAQ